jgi:hypothetical protein
MVQQTHAGRRAPRACRLGAGPAALAQAPRFHGASFPQPRGAHCALRHRGGPIDTLARIYADKLGALGPAGDRRGQARRQRHHRRRLRGQGRARRPHRADDAAAHARQQRDPAAQAALRPGEGLPAAVDDRHRRADGRRARQCAVLEPARVRRLRQEEGPHDLRHLGQRLQRAPVRRAAEAPDRHRPGARAYKAEARRTTTCSARQLDFAWANPATARNA